MLNNTNNKQLLQLSIIFTVSIKMLPQLLPDGFELSLIVRTLAYHGQRLFVLCISKVVFLFCSECQQSLRRGAHQFVKLSRVVQLRFSRHGDVGQILL